MHFTHFSVKEYLLRSDVFNTGQTRLRRICFPDGDREHDRLARSCLQYLCYDVFGGKNGFSEGKKLERYPFLAYAARFWYVHALRVKRMSEDIVPRAEKLFDSSNSNWILCSRVFEGDLQFYDQRPPYSSIGSHDFLIYCYKAEGHGKLDKQPRPIYYAALLGLTEIVKALRPQGLDCSARGGLYGFPLQAATHNSHQETVEYVVQQDVDLDQRGGFYGSAICAAAAQDLDRILDILIKAGADLISEDHDGRNCLHLACRYGARATVKALLEARADPLKELGLCKTPLYEAVESGDRESVSLLLDAGASANDMDYHRRVPVIWTAVTTGCQGVVEEILDHHADVNLAGPHGSTCLHEAAMRSHTAIIEKLLRNSADVNAQDRDGWSPLSFAVASENSTAAGLLISRGANVNTPNDDGWRPLHHAADKASEKMLAMLLSHGASVDAECSLSKTSLFLAVLSRSLSCVKTLLAHGASVTQVDNMGNTALDAALESGTTDIIEHLLDHHALCGIGDHIQGTSASTIDVQSSTVAAEISKTLLRGDKDLASQLTSSRHSVLSQSDLNSALLSCSLFNAPSLVESLLQQGASVSASNYNGRTPLHFSSKNNSLELTKLFLKHGAIIHAVDGSGYTPLDLAIGGGRANIETATYLVESGALATQGGPTEQPRRARTALWRASGRAHVRIIVGSV